MRAVSLAVSLLALPARADDARLRLMHEPIPYTDVIDAFDAHDSFDINIHFDYRHLSDRGSLYRELRAADGAVSQQKVGESEIDRNLLTLEVDVGLWRDVMAFVRMPLVLSDTRAIQGITSSALAGSDGSALFTLPVTSASRAGLDYIAFGGAWSVLNQTRAAWHPTWVLRVEGRRAVGKVLHPCIVGESANVCGTGGAEPGSSAGVSALLAETRFSRRFRHVEPYAGLAMLVQWASSTARFEGARPGPESSATLGAALIPWEDRGSYQRATLDLRLDVTYVARGTNYTALFDALGTSRDPSLQRNGAPFYGLTEQEQHLRYGGQLGVELQAARYVRFAAGTTLHWVSEHALSDRSPCSGPGTSDVDRMCRADNRERNELDAPGHRFFIRDQFLLGVYAQATAMF